jgi:hypothetical protein
MGPLRKLACVTVPSGLCATWWQTITHVFALRLYEIGSAPFAATTFMSKFTSRSPVTLPLTAPMPCAVWHVEQLNPALMWLLCSFQLVFRITWFDKSWHLPHSP